MEKAIFKIKKIAIRIFDILLKLKNFKDNKLNNDEIIIKISLDIINRKIILFDLIVYS